jgi:hypothetical protein
MSDETKRCGMCECELPQDKFNKRANGKCYAYCKPCQSVYSRNHYVKDPEPYKKRRRESGRRYYARNRNHVIEYLRTHPCLDCGESDPVVFEFDHLDRTAKTNEISNLIRQGWALERLKLEMSRCVVRCAHCHRRKTAKEFSWRMTR